MSTNMDMHQKGLLSSSTATPKLEDINTFHSLPGREEYTFPQLQWELETEDALVLHGEAYWIWESMDLNRLLLRS